MYELLLKGHLLIILTPNINHFIIITINTISIIIIIIRHFEIVFLLKYFFFELHINI